MTLDQLCQKMHDSPEDEFWMRCLRRYFRAQNSRHAKECGIIGVGLITFAQNRLNTFIRRAGR